MKTVSKIGMLIATLLLVWFGYSVVTKKSEKPFDPKDFERIAYFEQATVTKSIITDQSSKEFPGSIIFGAYTEQGAIVIMGSLPATKFLYDTAFSPLNMLSHGNMVVLETAQGVYGVMPKHVFGDDVDLVEMLSLAGFNVAPKGDIVTIPLAKEKMKGRITADLLNDLDPKELDGITCTVMTLNCFDNDSNIYQYQIKGILHYVNQTEKEYLFLSARNSKGERVSGSSINGEGMYVIRVPNSLFHEILGMSGGSVTTNIGGKEYFFGMNTFRTMFGIVSGKDTIRSTLIGFQPVLAKDI